MLPVDHCFIPDWLAAGPCDMLEHLTLLRMPVGEHVALAMWVADSTEGVPSPSNAPACCALQCWL